MNISVGKVADLNPENNLGKLLQMFETAASDQSIGKERKADGIRNNVEKGNDFIHVLQETLAVLMQSNNSENSSELDVNQNLSMVIEKLLLEDKNSDAEYMLPGFTLMTIAEKMDSPVKDENELSEEIFSALTAMTGLTGTMKEKIPAGMDHSLYDLKSVEPSLNERNVVQQREGLWNRNKTGQAGTKEITEKVITEFKINMADKLSEQKAAKTQPENSFGQAQDIKQQELPEGGLKTTSIRNIQASVLTGYADVEPAATEQEAAKTQPAISFGRMQDVNQPAIPEGGLKTTSIRNIQTSVLTGYADVEPAATEQEAAKTQPEISFGRMQDVNQPAIPEGGLKTTSIADHQEKSITGKAEAKLSINEVSIKNQVNKTISHAAAVAPENKSRSNISSEENAEDANLNALGIQNQVAQKEKPKMSNGQEMPFADKQPSPSIKDVQKNPAGNVVSPTTEFASVIDKIKSEFKSKAVSGEKNIDVNSSNTAVATGVRSSQTTANDISPAQVIDRVAAEFSDNLSNEGGRVKITLAPPSLGTLEMDVTVHNGKVRVLLVAENQDVQKMLSGNMDSLKGSLQSQGLTIERCDVMMQDRREQYSQNFNHHQAFNQEQSAKHQQNEGKGYNHLDAQTVIPSNITPAHQEIWRSGRISLFA